MVRAKGRRCDAMARADAGERSQGDPREIPGRSQGDPRERSEVPLCEVPMDKTGWARWLCVRCALCAAAVLLRGCLRRPRARARGLLYFCRNAQALIMNDPGPVRPIASGRTSRTQVADTDTTEHRRHASHIGHAARLPRDP